MENQKLEEMVEFTANLLNSTPEEVHRFVSENPIKYSDLKNFAEAAAVYPTKEEAKYIGNFGIDQFFTNVFNPQ